MDMFKKILVAIDYSTMSRKVFEAALSLAQTTGASLMLLHVFSLAEQNYRTALLASELVDEPSDELRYKSLPETYQEKWQQWEEQGREFLDSLSQEAKKAGVHTEFTQTWGEPGRDICELAQTWSAEVIFIGSRGLTGLKEMFMGSVSNYVTHHTPCSVLIVREDENVNLDSQSSISSFRSA